MSESPHLEVLHDHYKESFSYIRERERERDRLFLILIALFALLALQIQYPINFRGALSSITFLGIELDAGSLPLPAFLTATWVVTLAITLRYCQASINVERQYEYLHKLEVSVIVPIYVVSPLPSLESPPKRSATPSPCFSTSQQLLRL
jgi:hypothetical protein